MLNAQTVDAAIIHPLEDSDREAVNAAVASIQQTGGLFDWLDNTVARPSFDAMMRQIPGAAGVTYESAVIAGVSGIWARPAGAIQRKALMHLHGGGYSIGSADAYRAFTGQIASRVGVSSFLPDYRLAPENPYPAAFEDACAVYSGLFELSIESVALVGDSAGGGLTLALLAHMTGESEIGRCQAPVAPAVMSPWIDLALTGESLSTRADDDPLVSRKMVEAWASRYLDGNSPTLPAASALYGRLNGLPPVAIHVGTRETLLDDSRSYARRARAEGTPVDLHLWEGMMHVFPASVGILRASDSALSLMAAFLRKHLGLPQSP